jgi:hypothetical protein
MNYRKRDGCYRRSVKTIEFLKILTKSKIARVF